jgi:RNA polymerase sigma factor (sigma-70 family)
MDAHVTSGPRAPRRALVLPLARIGDERLARLVAAGSERAFAVIYQRYHQQLYRYCRSIAHTDADAQDALQSTLAGALAALQRGQRNAPLRPWLFRIAHNETISLLRRQRPTTELSESEQRAAASTEEHAESRARLAQLVADLRELPERQRGALVMRELSGLSHEQIAIALATTSGAAKQAIFDARQALADFSEGRAMACEDVRRAISNGDRRVLRARRVRAHLRGCEGCAAFAAAIPARRGELRILAPPLAPLAAAGVLAHLTQAGTAHGGGAGLGAAATAGAGKTIGATLAAKALVGVAVLTAATVGVSSVLPHTGHGRPAGSQSGSHGVSGTTSSSGSGRSLGAGAHGGAGAHLRAPGARRGNRAGAATGAGVLGGAGSPLMPAGKALGLGRGARGAPSARAHAKRLHGRGGTHSRAGRLRSTLPRASENHSSRSSGGATSAPRWSTEATARPQTSTPTVPTTPLAAESVRTAPAQGSELTTRK